MRTNRSFAAALAVVLLTTMVSLGGCGKPNPLAPPGTHFANPPVVVDSCFLELTTPDPPNVIPGDDSYLGAPGAKSPIVETIVFGGDSSTVEVCWRITTVGTTSTTKYNFSVLAVDQAAGSSIKGDLGNGRTNIDFGSRQVDTLITARFRAGRGGTVIIGGNYKLYTTWNSSTAGSTNATGVTSTMCHEAGPTWYIYRQWDERCVQVIKR